jgi:uracil phosphoribosyltransferase
MPYFNLSTQPSIANQFIAELRDVNVQTDRMRFRRNMERLGEIMAYEISRTMAYSLQEVETPLGIATVQMPDNQPVIASILRAGVPMHTGVLNIFDQADNAFVSAYRRHHKDGSFEIHVEYLSCPPLEGRVLIVADPMLATGASIVLSIQRLLEHGTPAKIHILTAIASAMGVDYVKRMLPQAHIWVGAVDEELTAKSYIVPGLGDAGDLAFGEKLQD